MDSGILGAEDNYCYKSLSKITKIVQNATPETEIIKSAEQLTLTKFSHTKYKTIEIDYPEIKNYECISGIRNPLERAVSAALMIMQTDPPYNADEVNYTLNRLLGFKSTFTEHQHKFFREDAILWPTEKLHEKISEFISNKNGRIRGKWRCRQRNANSVLQQISNENKQKILDFYNKDYELWENLQ